MLTLVASLLLSGPNPWPAKPLEADFALGAKVSTIHKGVDRVIGLDRVVIGKWTDGTRSKDVEEVILMTPALLSRWLGWLADREALSATQITARWQDMRKVFGEIPTVIVRLALFERNDGFELADISRPSLTELESVGFRWAQNSTGPDNQAPLSQLVLDRWGTEPTKLNSIPWWASSEQWRLLWPTGYQPPTWDGLQRGWNRLKVYTVQLPASSGVSFESGGKLFVQKGSRVLQAEIPGQGLRTFTVPRK